VGLAVQRRAGHCWAAPVPVGSALHRRAGRPVCFPHARAWLVSDQRRL